MRYKKQQFLSRTFLGWRRLWALTAVLSGMLMLMATHDAYAAINPLPIPPPQANSYGLEATKKQPPPTDAATITTPGNGGSYSNPLVTVSGLCKADLLVQVYDNGVLVGAVNCTNGSFSIQITLFPGQNDLTATMYDELGQAGPVSNTVTVNYNNASFSAFGQSITLTSTYARKAANPNTALEWRLLLSGGTGPYAFSIDWGDGSAPDLKSQALSGNVDISHTYKKSGLYHVTVKVTDVNGQTAFIQLVAIANGTPAAPGTTSNGTNGSGVATPPKVMWLPTAICFILLIPTYWLGRRSELVSLHRQLEKDMASYKEI